MKEEQQQELTIHENFLKKTYNLQEKLGSGSYGIVYKAIDISTNEIVAIKCCKGDSIQKGNKTYQQLISASTLREIATLKKLSHENILKLIGVKTNIKQNFMYLIFEYCETDLFKFLYKSQMDLLALSPMRQIVYELLKGVQFMHMNGLLHRDIKPSNILLKQEMNSEVTAKLADFGLVRNILPVPYIQIELGKDSLSSQFEQMRSFNQSKILTQGCCTLLYRSIEMLLGETKYSFEIDVWSCGCVLYELIMGRPLFNSDSQIGMIMEIFQKLGMPKENDNDFLYWKKLPYFSLKWPKFQKQDKWVKEVVQRTNAQCGDLLQKMIELNPKKRITVNDALLHPFFYSL